MDLDNDEELVTKQHNKQVRYIKLLADGKGLTHNQFKSFYGDYEELYDLLCEYMNAYNRECKDYEQTINELYEEKERYRKLYFEEKEKQEHIKINELSKPKVDLDKYEITIPLENIGLEDIEYYYKKGDKWYAHYKETQVDKTKVKELEEQAKSKVTEQELKDMIIGMLE